MAMMVITFSCEKDGALSDIQAVNDDEVTDQPITFTTNLGVLPSENTTRYGILDDTVISSTTQGTLRVWAYRHSASTTSISDYRGLEPYIYDIDNPNALFNNFYAGIKLELAGNTAPYSYFEGNHQYAWPNSSYALDFYAVYSTNPDFDGPKRYANGSMYYLASTYTERPSILTPICGSSDFRVSKQSDLLVAEPVLNKINQGTNEPIKFVFHHKYAQIRVKFWDTENLNSTLSNVALSVGSKSFIYAIIVTLDGKNSQTWGSSVLKNSSWPLYTPDDKTVLRGDNTDEYFATLVVPQMVREVTLKATYTNEKGTHDVSLNLDRQKFESGKIYTYYLYRSSEYILFTPPEVEPWKVEERGDIYF